MAVSGKSKKELIEENNALRSRLQELERSGTNDSRDSEQKLRQSHERLITVLNSLDALVYVADMETYEILFVNKFGHDIWGDVVGEICWKTLQNGQSGPCEFCTNAKLIDGSGKPVGIHRWEFQNTVDQQWYDCRDQAIQWTDGRLVRMEIATNIAEQKNAQEELKKSKEFLYNVINALDDSFFVKDQEHHWLMLNDAACELMGRPREELVGKSDYDLFSKEQADIFWERDNLVFETGRTNINEEQVTWHDQIRTISTKKSLYTDSVTGKKFITGTSRDITEQKKVGEVLSESEFQYRTTIDAMRDAIHVLDTDLRIVLINEKCIKWANELGIEIDSPVGCDLFELFPFLSDKIRDEYRSVLDSGKVMTTVETIQVAGREFITETRKIPVSEENKVVRVITVIRDITEQKKAETKIKEQYEFLNLVIESLKHPFYVIDPKDYTIKIANSAARISSKSGEQTCYNLTHKRNRPCQSREHICPLEEIKKTKQPVIVQHKHYDKDGNMRDMEVHAYPVFDKNKNLIQVIEYCLDITERRQAQKALRESLRTSDDIVHAIPSGLFIYQFEAPDKLILLDANPVAEQLTGIKICHWIGKEFNQIWPTGKKAGITDSFLSVMKTGETFETEDLQYEDERLEDAFRIRAFRLPGQRLAMAFENITERKKAERALRESEQRLKILFESAPDAIYLSDLKGNFVDGNKAAEQMVGYVKAELIGKSFVEMGLLSSEQVLRAIANLEKNSKGKPTGPDEFSLTRKDGSSVPVEIRTFPVRIGEQVLSLSIARDISARKEADKKLFEYRAQLKSLASELSLTEERERHRLATNLHDQISQALVISRIKLQALHASVSSAEIAGPLEEACENLDRIIQDTRTLTFDLSSPILYELGFEAAVSEWLEEQIRQKHGIKTQFEDDGLPKPLEDDVRVLLFRNVRELLINIVKHADARNVKVSIRRIRQQIFVSVEDDGIGFNPAEVAPNAGFGIFSIRERLEQLGGYFEIKSEPGSGSKFLMTAPLKCNKISIEDQLKS